jgi:2'-5' RNA ligase
MVLRAGYRLIEGSPARPVLRSSLIQRGRRRLTATAMSLADVVQVLEILHSAEVSAWLIGGWACDAVLGEQTREHSDLDLVVPVSHAPRAFEALGGRGFTIYKRHRAGLLNYGVEMIDGRRRRVALHPVELDAEGRGDWARRLTSRFPKPAEGSPELFVTGELGGRTLPCVSATGQVVLHTGYPPRENDRHNVSVLCSRLSVPLPPGYVSAWTTVLLVPVPEVIPVLDRWSGARVGAPGLPPHVTLLYPFLSESAIDASVEGELERLAASTPAFRYTLSHLDRFPGVLYAAPSPAALFVQLTRAVHERWPSHAPYGGAYDEIVPHVTLAAEEEPRGLAAAVRELLPIHAVARELQLLVMDSAGAWHPLRRFALGGARGPASRRRADRGDHAAGRRRAARPGRPTD